MSTALSAAIAVAGIAFVRALMWALSKLLPVNRLTVALFRERRLLHRWRWPSACNAEILAPDDLTYNAPRSRR